MFSNSRLSQKRPYVNHYRTSPLLRMMTSDYTITSNVTTNIPLFFETIYPNVSHLVSTFKGNNILKITLRIQTILTKLSGEDEEEEIKMYYSPPFEVLPTTNLLTSVYKRFQEGYMAWLDDFQGRGSGLMFRRIECAYLKMVKTSPMTGSSFIPLQFQKHSITNIQNIDNRCFLYCIIADSYPQPRNKTRPTPYTKYVSSFNHVFHDVTFPVKFNDIPRIEKRLQKAINVYGLENLSNPSSIYPIQISESKGMKEINLLYLENGQNTHYCLITDIDSLISDNRNKHKYYKCRNCLQAFSNTAARDNHLEVCGVHDSCRAILPPPRTTLRFSQPQFCSRLPFVIYADFEAVSVKLEEEGRLFQQRPISYGLYISSDHENILQSSYHSYTGEDCVEKFVTQVIKIYEHISYNRNFVRPLDTSTIPQIRDPLCWMCQKAPGTVVEHDHWTGRYRGMSCQSCNTKEGKSSKILPVFFHNGSNYDFHLFVTELMKHTQKRGPQVKVLAKSKEEYISITYGTFYNKIIFLDSYRFLQKSIADLAKSMAAEDYKILGSHHHQHLDLVTQKGIYPYEYVDSLSRLQEEALPEKEKFYSTLTQKEVTEEEYQKAQKVWDLFGCKTLRDYHNLYLQIDVLILADVFEKFRGFFVSHHNIDPCYCYSAPGLTWQCGLRHTDVTLDYLTDYDMLLMFEKGIRGGYSGVLGRRYATTTPTNQLLYLDANNLYGWAMSQPLPTGDFRWEDPGYFWDYCNTYGRYPYDPNRGYVLEVDLVHTPESFNRTWKYPLAPENKSVSSHQLSPYQHTLMEKEGAVEESTPKLILDMKPKYNYPIHYKLLEYYLFLGMRITKIHRVVSFKEEPWLAKYITFNTTQRTRATNTFEKDLWKLMNNAFYGKTLENIRNRKDVTLVRSEEEVRRYASKGTFQDYEVLSDDLTTITNKKASVKFDKPIYLGMCILDYAKLLMYKFYYDTAEPLWPGNEILYHDTDSLVLSIPCTRKKLEEDMMSIRDKHLDTSDYPTSHPLFTNANKKVPGLMKDELNGRIMTEFIALRSKVYSYVVEGAVTKKAKGINKGTIENHLSFADFHNSLFNDTIEKRDTYSLQSKKHEMFILRQEKKALSAFDNKRWIGPDRIYTEPFV